MSIPSAQAQVPLRAARDINDRGETVLARRVLEKTASQVARDETQAGGSTGGFLGIGARNSLSARPGASVELAGNIASLHVTVGMPYPVPLRQATEELRHRISERVTALTGVEVRQVDIDVVWLQSPDGDRPRRKLQ